MVPILNDRQPRWTAASACLALLCVAAGACAQNAADLFALTFTPGPLGGDYTAPPAAAQTDRADEPNDENPEARLLESARRITESLGREEALNGPRSSRLIPDLAALSSVYLELDDPVLAIAALERAQQIIRTNEGLHSLDQVAIVEQLVDGMQAAGLVDEAAELQNSLLELARRNEGDPRAPPVLASVAGRQLAAVRQYLESHRWRETREPVPNEDVTGWDPSTPESERATAGSSLGRLRNRMDDVVREALRSDDYELGDALGLDDELAEIYRLADRHNDFVEEGIGALSGFLPRESGFNDRELALAALRRARRLQSTGVQAALGNRESAEFFALEDQLIQTYYLENDYPDLHTRYETEGHGSASLISRRGAIEIVYLPGASVLEAKVINRLSTGTSPIDVAWALVELGDWHLLASRNGTALETYQDAHDFLVREAVSAEDAANIFAPAVPAILPAFFSGSRVFDPTHAYRGYVDVAIETGRYGQPVEVRIVDASPGTTSAIKSRAVGYVEQSRFRPRFVDGRMGRSDRFALRYYFDY